MTPGHSKSNVRGVGFSQSLPEVESEQLVVECRYRKSVPQRLKDFLAQAKSSARKGCFPALVVKGRYQHGAIVIRDLDRSIYWFGELEV